jgi:hypothetical protein
MVLTRERRRCSSRPRSSVTTTRDGQPLVRLRGPGGFLLLTIHLASRLKGSLVWGEVGFAPPRYITPS